MTFHYHLITIALIFLVNSCVDGNKDIDSTEITSRYLEDKMRIQHSFINDVESFRLKARMKEGYEVNFDSINNNFPSDFTLYNNFIYGHYGNKKKLKAYPIRMENLINCFIDNIYYNTDSLLCVATVIVEESAEQMERIDFEPPIEKYTGMLVIGKRTSKDSEFVLFPMKELFLKANNYNLITPRLRSFYHDNIKRHNDIEGIHKHVMDTTLFRRSK